MITILAMVMTTMMIMVCNYDRLMVRRMMIRMMLMMAVKVNDDVDDVKCC
jgi:hypothetical protein